MRFENATTSELTTSSGNLALEKRSLNKQAIAFMTAHTSADTRSLNLRSPSGS
ncbi:hypothetical protein H6G81_19385 [Scytonema hofmannii FACHB-248]|uniref:Uncharacterized protein n=1 Tax=Scytonema hofmannii FACHB-248 TaxID=1842502 RepID=A0ABR8GU80_9CYAN|nr:MULTISPECIES: hypothetical protein [Nostocales]MBD2606635.1 hypothetical protein [Scytonema hofmannii FACHB-248]